MSTEKMRKDFEKWECEADDGPQTDPVWLMYDASRDEYPLDKIQDRWDVWKASREAIEVELPDRYSEVYGVIARDEDGEIIDYQETVKQIKSLGLKVKP